MKQSLFALGLSWLLGFAAPAMAGLQISPISLSLEANQQAEGIWLTNTGTTVMHAQVRVFHWTQVNGQDLLAPTEALLASPPMLQIAPGQQQLLRIVRITPPQAQQEQAYRVLVDELPITQGEDSKRSQLRFVMRYSMPVFVRPLQAAQPQLHWRITTDAAGQPALHVHNHGNAHARLAHLHRVSADGTTTETLMPGLLGYVLPGASQTWPLPATLTAKKSPTELSQLSRELKIDVNGMVIAPNFEATDAAPTR